eukprot:TRINITY_DN63936_c0_g1_i1.p1 TRINITY_DN63936_c0_g1~~TRINITY_DN63936_c0_g1_i1.p1  ORF type:complete len:359 (-),score=72.58 TRINITY_DN63936_c0_g1_i1:36-998(-)
MDTSLRFSDEARRLCSLMLQREPGHRPPAKDVAGMSSAWFANTGHARSRSLSHTGITASRGSFSSFGSWPEATGDLLAHSWLSPTVQASAPMPAVQVKDPSPELLKVKAENQALLKRCNQVTGENQTLLDRCNQAEARCLKLEEDVATRDTCASAREEQFLKMTSLCQQLQEAANQSKYEAPNLFPFAEAEVERSKSERHVDSALVHFQESTDLSDIVYHQDEPPEPTELHVAEALCQDLRRQLEAVEAEAKAQEHRAERAETEVADMGEKLELARAQCQQLSAQCEELHESLSAKAAELTKRRKTSFFACLRLSGQRKS